MVDVGLFIDADLGINNVVTLSVNNAVLIDSPWQNPFAESNSEHFQYLTIENLINKEQTDKEKVFKFNFFLDTKMYIRSREVSNLVTLIAEVSGFADMFMIFGTFCLGILNQARMKSVLAKYMGPLEYPNRKPPKGKPRPVRLLSQVMSYRVLKESLVHSLYSAWCPHRFINRR